jgi:hypothetical protein
MKHNVLLSALLVLFGASVSVAQEKVSSGEYVAKDLPCDMVFVKRVQARSEVLYNERFTTYPLFFTAGRLTGPLHSEPLRKDRNAKATV